MSGEIPAGMAQTPLIAIIPRVFLGLNLCALKKLACVEKRLVRCPPTEEPATKIRSARPPCFAMLAWVHAKALATSSMCAGCAKLPG